MSNKTIFGLPVDVLSASNMSFTASQVDGKYVLKSGDSMSGNLAMEGGAGIDVKDEGNVSVDGKLDVKGYGQFSGNLGVLGNSTVSGLLEAPGGVSSGTLEATGEATFYDQVTMEGKLDLKGNGFFRENLDVLGICNVGGVLEAAGGAYIDGKIDVTGPATFAWDVKMDTKLDVKGDVKTEGNLLAMGTLGAVGNATFAGNALVIGVLEVNDTVTALSNLIVADEAVATGVISAEAGIFKPDLVVDPAVGVEVIGNVSTDPITSIGDKDNFTPDVNAWSAGWRFVVKAGQNLLVSHLLYASDNMTTNRDVGIWDATGNLLVQATVSNTDPHDALENWHIHALDQKDYVTLQGGQEYTIGGLYAANEPVTIFGDNGTAVANSTYIDATPSGMLKLNTPTLEWPNSLSGPGIIYNCNFYFQVTQPTAQLLYSGITRLPCNPRICLSRTTAQSIPTDDPITITWDTVRWASIGSANITLDHDNAFIVVPVNGMYMLSYTVIWDSGGSGEKTSNVWVNSDPDQCWGRLTFASSIEEFHTVTDTVLLNAGDTLQLVVQQFSGGSIDCMGNAANHFSCTLLYGT